MQAALIIAQILGVLPGLISAIETAMGPGNGATKLEAVVSAIMPMIPDQLAPKILPVVKFWIGTLVAAYKASHPETPVGKVFNPSGANAPTAQAAPAAVSPFGLPLSNFKPDPAAVGGP